MNNELKKLGEKTYCLENPVNIGFYVLENNDICLIDTGSSKDYAKLIEKILVANNWNLKTIINTHSHADHISGNKYLQSKYNCKIYSSKIETYFINSPILEPALLYGASPAKDLYSHILYAPESNCDCIENLNVDGIKVINLNGHSAGLIGIVTSDNVCFVGDAYTSDRILEKYAIQYIYDLDKFIESLNYLLTTDFNFYVPSHGRIAKKENVFDIINKNIDNALSIKEKIYEFVSTDNKIVYSELIKKVFNYYGVRISTMQYFLISATIRAYLTSLERDNKIKFVYENNEMIIETFKNN